MRNIRHSLAVSDRQSSRTSGLALTRPVAVDTMTGKKAMKMATTMHDLLPTPSQTMNSGAGAIFGISWNMDVPIERLAYPGRERDGDR
jgi:hypothetical protein